ncbi:hypothetical protein ERJ75_000705700 [Trypanosoma vivax]|uniref:Trans-sialidase n=1 Tax=Trypanosoma vivax (strain Y486) TaxID=1055687 RepID=G0TU28_TRYVY|nr:hypothetical protein ERJ75_000705700 [Trypanosoma vivax]CCC47462.1 conserved hypothetical protein [Trypanosoma vivax Y486]
MISPTLLWYKAQQQNQRGQLCDSDAIADLSLWVRALRTERLKAQCSEQRPSEEGESASRRQQDQLRVYAVHRRTVYLHHARQLSQFSDAHDFYRLMMWCHDHSVFIHPAVRMHRRASPYRDHAFTVSENVERLTPLLAIPEALVIGFKTPEEGENNLRDEQREKEFNKLNSGEESDTDICQFFFDSISMIVSDLLTAKSSPLTDPRWAFAELLERVRSMKNAPYFEDSVLMDADATGLADVLLQMIRNYINGGPLVGKVDRTVLRWAVSVSLSHSTPLVIAAERSIGIIPMVHLFPHGGKDTNSYIVARTSHPSSAARIAAYFAHHHHYDFTHQREGKWIYVVPSRPLLAGEDISMQAMAPVCSRDSEAEKMWRLSCGTAPDGYLTSLAVAKQQQKLTDELIAKGEELMKRGPL